MKKILILSTEEDVINSNKLGLLKKNIIIISLHKEVEDKLKELNIKDYKTNEEYELEKTYYNIDKESMEFSKIWFNEIKDLMKYGKITLGECIRCSYLFSEIYKNIRLLKNIINKEKPKEISTCYYKNFIPQNFLIENNDNSIYEIIKEIIKNKGIKLIPIGIKNSQIKKKKKNDYLKKILSKLQNNLLIRLKSNKKKKVLLIGSANQFSSIISELKRMDYITIRGGDNFGLSLLNNRGDYYITFKYFNTRKINKRLSIAKKILNKYYKEVKLRDKFRSKFIYGGVDYWNVFKVKLRFLYKDEFLNTIKNIEIINLLSNRGYFDLIAVSTDINTFEKTLVIATKNVNKQSIVIQHGATTHPVSFLPLTADYIAVWGDTSKNWLEKEGKINEKRIIVTGCGKFDSYFSRYKKNKEKVYNFFKISKNKKIILYAPAFHYRYGQFPNFQLNIPQITEIYKEMFKSIEKLMGFHLIIKLHHSDRLIDLPIKIAKEMNFRKYSIIQSYDLHSLINASEMVITSWSTVGYEAMLLKKPVIVIDFTLDRRSDSGNYVKYNAAIGVYKKSILSKTINKISQDNKFKDELITKSQIFLKRSLHKMDGKSSHRIAKAIDNIIKGKL